MTKKTVSTDTLLSAILHELSQIKARDIVLMDLRGIESAVCSYFVVCTGNSSTHVHSIAGQVEKQVSRTTGERPWHVEGADNAQWCTSSRRRPASSTTWNPFGAMPRSLGS